MAEGQASRHPTGSSHTEVLKSTKKSAVQTGSLRARHQAPSSASLLPPPTEVS